MRSKLYGTLTSNAHKQAKTLGGGRNPTYMSMAINIDSKNGSDLSVEVDVTYDKDTNDISVQVMIPEKLLNKVTVNGKPLIPVWKLTKPKKFQGLTSTDTPF